MEFGLLGPLEARVDGRLIGVSSPKLRTLLAALLLEPGRPVPLGSLIDAIWGAERPKNPRRALHVCVTRARALLVGSSARPLITTDAGGYRIDVAADAVDVLSFRRHLERADLAAAQADVDGEWEALTAALNLWRGEALADVSSEMLHREYGYALTELRLQTAERQIDLSLRAGRQVEIVGELATLAARHPLREKLWAQLMMALYRCGRRGDALMTFHAARRHLADELGISPGEGLLKLYTTILHGGAAPDDHGEALPAVPRQLPAEPPGFAGRTAQLNRMHGVLEEHEATPTGRTTVLIVNGMPGVGKTTLAAHWSRTVADRFPDGQIWVNMRGYHNRDAVPPRQALAFVLRALRVSGAEIPPDLDGRAALFRSLVDGRQMLFVLDNVASSDQVRPLLPGGAGNFVLITTRSDLPAMVASEAATTVRLDVFSTEEARQMLRPRIGRRRIDAEPKAVDRIIDRCGRLPLALSVVAARAAARPTFSLAAVERQLAEADDQLDAFSSRDVAIDVRAAFSRSYTTLTPSAARLFRVLGRHPAAEASTSAVAGLVGLAANRVRPLLDELAAAHLIVEHHPGRFTLHGLVHAYARELATTAEHPR